MEKNLFLEHLDIALPAEEFQIAKDLPEDTLKQLYSDVYNYGPNMDNALKAAEDVLAHKANYDSYDKVQQEFINTNEKAVAHQLWDELEEIGDTLDESLQVERFQGIDALIGAHIGNKVSFYTPFGVMISTISYALMAVYFLGEEEKSAILEDVNWILEMLGLNGRDYVLASSLTFIS